MQADAQPQLKRSQPPPRSLGSIAFGNSLAVPFLFTIAFLVTYPPIESRPPYHHPSMTPAIVVLVCGIFGASYVLICIIRAFRAGPSGGIGSAVGALVLLVAFAAELFLASIAIRGR